MPAKIVMPAAQLCMAAPAELILILIFHAAIALDISSADNIFDIAFTPLFHLLMPLH